MISFQNITKTYPSLQSPIRALADVSFDIKKGEFLCLVGKSGAGKTTLIKLLIGEEKPTTGAVMFNDIDIARLKHSALQKIRRKIGVVHQDYKLLDQKNVRENLNYIMQILGVSEESIARDVPRVLSITGLAQRANNFPAELSGGEKQRLAIARALIHRPDLIIADEPTGNLDWQNTSEIINLLKKINSMGATVLLSTHDREIIANLNGRVVKLENGKLISDKS